MDKIDIFPKGFLCSGITAGLKKEAKKDLGLIYSEKDSALGAVYTQNKFPAAPVEHCKKITPSDKFRALIINSGNANAGTGQAGKDANLKLTNKLADLLKIEPEQTFISSTGIIGRPFPLKKIENSLDKLIDKLERGTASISEAIMTTDLAPKTAFVKIEVEGKTYSATGFAKGSGMIYPNMATMLAYIITDAPIPCSRIQSIAQEAADSSFNCINVDGDSSTNDSFFLISSNPVEKLSETSLLKVAEGVGKIACSLAQKIAADGEGAEHLIETVVKGAYSKKEAISVMKAVLNSNLVKTAINGKDPNWGRILMAVGNGLVRGNLSVSIELQKTPVFIKGEPIDYNEAKLAKLMEQFKVNIGVDLGSGNYSATGWGCDLSGEYIRINADYST